MCGGLAGFAFALIGLLLLGQYGNESIGFGSLTFGQIAISLDGISAALFIGAAEFFFHAIEFDVYSLPPSPSYPESVTKILKNPESEYIKKQNELLHFNYTIASILYNIAIMALFSGLLFAMWPFNPWIAAIITGFGILVEGLQVVRTQGRKAKAEETSKTPGDAKTTTGLGSR